MWGYNIFVNIDERDRFLIFVLFLKYISVLYLLILVKNCSKSLQ